MGEKLGKKHILSINLNLVTLHVTSNIFFFFSFEIKACENEYYRWS